jgi:CBS domain-containing protein
MVQASDLMQENFVSVDVESTAAELIGKLETSRQTYALVFDGKKYLGLVTKKWLLTTRIDPDVMKLKNLIKKRNKSKTPFYVPKLSAETELKEIVRLLVASDVRALPVVEHMAGEKDKFEKILGVVDSMSVLSAIKKEYANVPASKLAIKKLIFAPEDEEIGKVIQTMDKNHISHIPVIGSSGKLAGVVSIIDILEKIHVWGRCRGQHISKSASHNVWKVTGFGTGETTSILSAPVRNIIANISTVASCSPDTSVSEIIRQMADRNRASMILVDKDNKPVGIITVKDILEDFAKG